ncbi:MAG TPA: hypothetical protein VFT57_17350, partial [Gemmatimonadaceae bacterium]|nr:hypothetical protein [Gemmatimonadaceae bacterium]
EAARPLARPGSHPELATPIDWWPTWRAALDPRKESNQSALLSPHSNAKFTGKRRLSKREDAWSDMISPGAHMDALPRLSGATTR